MGSPKGLDYGAGLNPPPRFGERGGDGGRLRRLWRLLSCNRRGRRDPIHHISVKQRRVRLPVLDGQGVERTSFVQELPDQRPDDFVRIAKRQPLRDEVVGDVGGEQKT